MRGENAIGRVGKEGDNGLIDNVEVIVHPDLFILEPNFGFFFENTKLVLERVKIQS